MSTTDTAIDPRQVGGTYETAGWGIYRVVYIWPTGDFSVIWQGESQAGMYALLPWHPDRDAVVSLSFSDADQEAVDNLRAALERLDKVPDIGERVAGKLDLVFDAMDAGLIATDQEAPGSDATDSEAVADVEALDGNQLVGLVLDGLFQAPAGADSGAVADTDQEAETLTGQVGTGKAIHEIQTEGTGWRGDEVTSKCGRTGLLSKPGATINCKRCQKS